jgi:predicted aspartyl protease
VNFKFDPKEHLVFVTARIVGPAGDVAVHLALDTGASSTLIAWNALKLAGYGPDNQSSQVEMITGSGIEQVPKIKLKQIDSLGKRRRGLEVVAHTLPPGARIDGLLGLDFFRKLRLAIDFRKNTITLF